MLRILATAAALLTALTASVSAQSEGRVVLVELYTSQGCYSCPPADKLLGELAERDDVIPLALHVDYWDYIGWKDIFAKPAHTQRQRAYAKTWNERMIYTPQMVVGGLHPVVGSRPMDVAELIQKHAMAEPVVALELTRSGDSVAIVATALSDVPAAEVHLVRYTPEQTVDIKRGENRGKRLTYHNIVTSWQTLATWDAAAPLELTAEAAGDAPVVVIVQAEGYGMVLSAAQLR
ncbi:DUF1223 domain-containing protein [Pseudaestuariivita sp.]|uniref:DUF1223 domain-containing protein n=1 Tax=Pseudaestuariivita sp. TaxID=2211669 RepID=UPI0040592880